MNRMPPMFGQKHLSFVGSPPIISPSWVICLFNHYYLYIILLVIHPMTYSHYIGLLIYHFTEVGKCPTFFTSRNTFKWGIFSPFFFFLKWCDVKSAEVIWDGALSLSLGLQVLGQINDVLGPRFFGGAGAQETMVNHRGFGGIPRVEIWRSSHFQHTKFGW